MCVVALGAYVPETRKQYSLTRWIEKNSSRVYGLGVQRVRRDDIWLAYKICFPHQSVIPFISGSPLLSKILDPPQSFIIVALLKPTIS